MNIFYSLSGLEYHCFLFCFVFWFSALPPLQVLSTTPSQIELLSSSCYNFKKAGK